MTPETLEPLPPMNEEELKTARQKMKLALMANVCEVIFRKVNGMKRVMICTLKDEIIPEDSEKYHYTSDTSAKYSNPELLHVYDLEKKAWRTFRIDHVYSVRVNNKWDSPEEESPFFSYKTSVFLLQNADGPYHVYS